ncbi:hypothetical protein MMC24_000658 [Lignoscripta atroalba]|nr:hypothetical protein [Lignoscripta atroalba]
MVDDCQEEVSTMEINSWDGDGLDQRVDNLLTAGKTTRRKKSLRGLVSLPERNESTPTSENRPIPQAQGSTEHSPPLSSLTREPLSTPAAVLSIGPSYTSRMSVTVEYDGVEKPVTPAAHAIGSLSAIHARTASHQERPAKLSNLPVRSRLDSGLNTEHSEPNLASITGIREAETRKVLRQKSSNAIFQTRVQRGLQMPMAFSFVGRDRRASTTADQPPQISPMEATSQRPLTAGAKAFPDDDKVGHQHSPMQLGSAQLAKAKRDGYSNSTQRSLWQASYDTAEVRESFRSALTTDSSQLGSASTDRTSIFTKESIASDTATDFSDMSLSKDEGMTVDEAIGMYSAGFLDSRSNSPDEVPRTCTSTEETRRRSVKIAEAMGDSIGAPCPPSPTSSRLQSTTGIKFGDACRSPSPLSLPVNSATTSHDQYGFRKTTHRISIAQYDTWNSHHSVIQDRRNKKWEAFMADQGLSILDPIRFPDRSAKVQRFVRKGIPPSWRGAAWFFYAGGDNFVHKHPNLYNDLVVRSQTELRDDDKESIERDLHRTFPDNIHFKPIDPVASTMEAPLLHSLRHVLYAFALHHPRIGYCQSLNFITGLLLLFLSEEKAFWMLHIITKSYLPGTHETSLEGANVDLWLLMLALKEAIPGIWAKVGGDISASAARLPPVSLCTTSWFMSLFIGTLPIESVLRVWDVLFYEGSRTLFRVAIAIFKLGEMEIKSISDPMEVFQVVQGLPRGMLDVGRLMEVAFRRGGITQVWVERKRRERREWYAKERVRLGTISGNEGGAKTTNLQGNAGRVRADSVWRRRVGWGK